MLTEKAASISGALDEAAKPEGARPQATQAKGGCLGAVLLLLVACVLDVWLARG
jgi:hypothetical protein